MFACVVYVTDLCGLEEFVARVTAESVRCRNIDRKAAPWVNLFLVKLLVWENASNTYLRFANTNPVRHFTWLEP